MNRDNWYLINVENKILGRISTVIAHYLMGKHQNFYLPYLKIYNYVVVINASKISVTGQKLLKKIYYRHSGYVGNLKKFFLKDMLKKFPERVIKYSVKGMLPKNRLGKYMLTRLKIYPNNLHNHVAQQPFLIKI